MYQRPEAHFRTQYDDRYDDRYDRYDRYDDRRRSRYDDDRRSSRYDDDRRSSRYDDRRSSRYDDYGYDDRRASRVSLSIFPRRSTAAMLTVLFVCFASMLMTTMPTPVALLLAACLASLTTEAAAPTPLALPMTTHTASLLLDPRSTNPLVVALPAKTLLPLAVIWPMPPPDPLATCIKACDKG